MASNGELSRIASHNGMGLSERTKSGKRTRTTPTRYTYSSTRCGKKNKNPESKSDKEIIDILNMRIKTSSDPMEIKGCLYFIRTYKKHKKALKKMYNSYLKK